MYRCLTRELRTSTFEPVHIVHEGSRVDEGRPFFAMYGLTFLSTPPSPERSSHSSAKVLVSAVFSTSIGKIVVKLR